MKLLISRHLFADKYDYRQEWLRFITTLAEDDGGSHLRLRVIKAIAQIVESPGGSLWLLDAGSQRYVPAESWNDRPVDESQPATGALATFLARTQQVVDLEELAKHPALYGGLQMPDWLGLTRTPWLIVPLQRGEQLLGFAILQRSRAPRHLDREDRELLATIGRQAAGFLAEYQAQSALDDSRELDLFNRRFAFVVHDLKTMISQLSLLLGNADKHGQNPAFQGDLIESVRDSVNSMNRLLGQINAERNKGSGEASLDLVALVRQLVDRRVASSSEIILDCRASNLPVDADEGRMTAIIGHLLQNAVDAASHAVRITLRGAPDGTRAVVEVEDDGPGMDPEFVRDQLFRPFASTKRSGLGIGSYQCRELTRELGGWLTVSSVPGKGTTMRVTFPSHVRPRADGPRVRAAR
jgi:putative PEP-CTERM system histidine kinase